MSSILRSGVEKIFGTHTEKEWLDTHRPWLIMTAGAFVMGLIFSKHLIRAAQPPKAFVLLVTIQFPTVEEKAEFKALFEPMADYVRRQEFGTLSYECAESDKNERQVVIIERYASRDAYANEHKTSKEFLAYKEKMSELDRKGHMVIHGHSYYETNVGFMSRK